MSVIEHPTSDNRQPTSSVVLEACGLVRRFQEGGRTLDVLRGVDLMVEAGRWLTILGRSGSGKSTLLHLLGGLDRPTSGDVRFEGASLFSLSDRQIDRYRCEQVGFVFQFYHLLPELSALENVLIGGMLRYSIAAWPGRRKRYRQRAEAVLERVGLQDRMRHRPNKLSGGERQRVAIARSLINEPAVLLADEPTGNLDVDTSGSILELFEQLHADGQTVVMVTHDQAVADAGDDVVTLRQGRLVANDSG